MSMRSTWLALPLLLTACSGGPTDREKNLTSEQVAGVYEICSLRFAPSGGQLPAVDIRAAVMDTAPTPPLRQPILKVARGTLVFELEYVPRNDFLEQRLSGRYALGPETLTLTFPGSEEVQARSTLLLPTPLVMRADVAARTLTVGAEQPAYTVARADYARLAGVAETNLAPQIQGSVSGRLASSCD
jgi:hypothetical protein